MICRLLNRNPDEHNHNVHALALAAVVFERPHAVLLLVPVRARRAVHPAPAHVRLAVRGRRLGARRDVRLLALAVGPRTRLVERRRRHQVLHNGAVAGKLERRRAGALRGRFRDDGLEHRALLQQLATRTIGKQEYGTLCPVGPSARVSSHNYVGVPLLRLGVVVKLGIANGTTAHLSRLLARIVLAVFGGLSSRETAGRS